MRKVKFPLKQTTPLQKERATSFRGTFCAYNAVKAVEYAVRKKCFKSQFL